MPTTDASIEHAKVMQDSSATAVASNLLKGVSSWITAQDTQEEDNASTSSE